MLLADAIAAVTDVTSRAAVTKTRGRGHPARVPPQFTPYSTGQNNLFIVGAIGSGSCGNIGGCGGGGGGGGGFGGGSCGGGGGGGGGGGCGGGGGGGGGC